MPFFKRDKKINFDKDDTEKDFSSKKLKEDKLDRSINLEKGLIVKKKTKIGFRRKKDEIEEKKQLDEGIKKIEEEKVKDIVDEVFLEDSKIKTDDSEEQKIFSTKKKTLIKKDLSGKPIFLEDTGEKLGIVFDSIYDKDSNLVGYKIKDEKSDAVLSFPLEQFDYNKDGLIFIPGWYTNAVKIIEKLEFKDRVSPDLTALLSDDDVSNNELYEIFVKYDDDMVDYIQDAISLKDMLDNRLKILEKQRLASKDDLINLTEKRLIKDIDRKEFSEEIIHLRNKVNILDINIGKCKNLIKRLEGTSFGYLGKIRNTDQPKNKDIYKNVFEEKKEHIQNIKEKKPDELFKEKYYLLKERYEKLEDDYQELKTAVDKLFVKSEMEK